MRDSLSEAKGRLGERFLGFRGAPHFGGGLTMSGHHGDFSLFEACKEHVKHVKELHQCFNFTTIVIVSDNL